MISKLAAVLCRRSPLIFAPTVNWITFTRGSLGQGGVHRMARADFNVRAGKVAWRHTAPAALFFVHGSLAAMRGNFPGCHGPQPYWTPPPFRRRRRRDQLRPGPGERASRSANAHAAAPCSSRHCRNRNRQLAIDSTFRHRSRHRYWSSNRSSRRAIPNLPLRFNDNAILLVRRRNYFR